MLRVIGRGGMGVVLEALDRTLERSVALKLIVGGGNFDARGYFAREARSLAAFQHPGVVRVFDGDVAGDTPYLAMELLDGETLQELTVTAPPPVEQVAGWLDALLDALGAVHARGMLHRDLKPSNIFIERSGRPVLIDFGLVANPETPRLTTTGVILGTPRFLPPELLNSGTATPCADLYALAMSFVEVLIGRSPHMEPGEPNRLEAVLKSIQSGAYLARARAALPPGPVTDVLLKAIAFHPVERYPDAASMRAALSRAPARTSTRPPRPEKPPAAVLRPPPSGLGAPAAGLRPHAWLAALLLLTTLGALYRSVPTPEPTPSAPASSGAAPEVMLSPASAVALRDRIHDLVLPVARALEVELEGFQAWQLASQLDMKNIQSTTRESRRRYLAEKRQKGGAERLDTLAREVARVVEAVRAPARAFLAADQPAYPAVQVAFRLADVRECGIALEVLGTHAAGQVVRSWLDGQPASLSSRVLKSLVHRSDREHSQRLALLEAAADHLDARRRRGPVDGDDAQAMSMLMMEMMDALRMVRPEDPVRNRPVMALWAPWSAAFGQVPGLVDVDRRIRAGQ